jgi:hypothetical protein
VLLTSGAGDCLSGTRLARGFEAPPLMGACLAGEILEMLVEGPPGFPVEGDGLR